MIIYQSPKIEQMLNKTSIYKFLILLSGFTPILMFTSHNLQYLTNKDFYEIFIIFIFISFIILITVSLFIYFKVKKNYIIFFLALNSFLFFLWGDLKGLIEVKFQTYNPGVYYYSLVIGLNIIFFLINKFSLIKFFEIFFISLFFLNLLVIIFKILFINSINFKFQNENHLIKNNSNIYIIIVDGYGGQKYLQSNLNFNNKNFQTFLTSKNFYINENMFSNYSSSGASIHSLLESNYVHFGNEINLSNHYPELFKKKLPYVISLAKKNGYSFYSAPWEGCYNILEDICINQNIKVGKISKNLYLMTPLNNHFHNISEKISDKLKDIFIKKLHVRYNSLQNFNSNFEKYKQSNDKKFFFIHNLAPHAPYEFNPDCSKKENFLNYVSTSLNDKTYSLEVQKSLYLDNIKCTNKILTSVIQKILELDPNSIILLSSDHGARLGKNYLLEKKQNSVDYKNINQETFFSIFNSFSAIYLPQKCHVYFQKINSLVNQSRILLSCLLDEKIKFLKNEFYLILENKQLINLNEKKFIIKQNTNN